MGADKPPREPTQPKQARRFGKLLKRAGNRTEKPEKRSKKWPPDVSDGGRNFIDFSP